MSDPKTRPILFSGPIVVTTWERFAPMRCNPLPPLGFCWTAFRL